MQTTTIPSQKVKAQVDGESPKNDFSLFGPWSPWASRNLLSRMTCHCNFWWYGPSPSAKHSVMVQVMVYICQEKSREKAWSLHDLSTAHFMSWVWLLLMQRCSFLTVRRTLQCLSPLTVFSLAMLSYLILHGLGEEAPQTEEAYWIDHLFTLPKCYSIF